MIVQALVEGLKSVISQSLTPTPETKQITPLSIIFIGAVSVVSLILAEVFLGLSLYKMFHFNYGYGEGFSMLMAALMNLGQAAICLVVIRWHLKKMVRENIVVKEYKLVKGVLYSLIKGYKSK